MEPELRALLQAGLPDVPPDRINWGEHPQDNSRNYIVLHLISASEGRTMQGRDGLERSRVQIDCYATNFGAARQMARSVKGVLDFYRGGQFLGVFLDTIRLPRETPPNRDGGTDAGDQLYNASLDFIVNWRNQHG